MLMLRTNSLTIVEAKSFFLETSEKVCDGKNDFPPSPQCAVAPSLRILKKPDSPHNSPQEFLTLDVRKSNFSHFMETLRFGFKFLNKFWSSAQFHNFVYYN